MLRTMKKIMEGEIKSKIEEEKIKQMQMKKRVREEVKAKVRT